MKWCIANDNNTMRLEFIISAKIAASYMTNQEDNLFTYVANILYVAISIAFQWCSQTFNGCQGYQKSSPGKFQTAQFSHHMLLLK